MIQFLFFRIILASTAATATKTTQAPPQQLVVLSPACEPWPALRRGEAPVGLDSREMNHMPNSVRYARLDTRSRDGMVVVALILVPAGLVSDFASRGIKGTRCRRHPISGR